MIEIRIPEIKAYDWLQANRDKARVLHQHSSPDHMRVFAVEIDYVSEEVFNQDKAKRISDQDWSNQHWAIRGKKTFLVWRFNQGKVWALNIFEFIYWLNSFEDGHDFETGGYEVIEMYLREKSGKAVVVAPTWYSVDYDDHPNPNLSKQQCFTLPKWGQKLVLEKNITKELAISFLDEVWFK